MAHTRGYYFVNGKIGNIFKDASLLEIVEQLGECSYRCEAGPLSLNLAYQELKRRAEVETITGEGCCAKRAEFMLYNTKAVQDPTYSCSAHLSDMLEPGESIVTTNDIPDGEVCCFVRIQNNKE